MPRKIVEHKGESGSLTPTFDDLVDAARGVVRAHALRDDAEASDDDVGDAIAGLERCLSSLTLVEHSEAGPHSGGGR